MSRPMTLLTVLVWTVEAAILAWAVLYLAEYFGWSVVREAGGRIV